MCVPKIDTLVMKVLHGTTSSPEIADINLILQGSLCQIFYHNPMDGNVFNLKI